MNQAIPTTYLKLMQAAYKDPGHVAEVVARHVIHVESPASEARETLGETLKGLLAGREAEHASPDIKHAKTILEAVNANVKNRHRSFLNPEDKLQVQWVTEADGVVAVGLNVLKGEKSCAGVTTYITVAAGEPGAMLVSPIYPSKARTPGLPTTDGNRWAFEHSHISF